MARERKRSADEAGVGPDPQQTRHLMPLKELRRYRLIKGEPDIRGWSVFTSNGREVGAVDDLLVDPSIGEAVMLDIDLKESGRRTVAPIRAAWIDRESKRVILDSAQLTVESELPALGRSAPAEEELRQLGERREAEPGKRAREVATVAPLPPGSEVVVERRVVSADDPSWTAGGPMPGEPPHEAPLPPDARTPDQNRRLVEEVIVRRRYVDVAELEALERSATSRGEQGPLEARG